MKYDSIRLLCTEFARVSLGGVEKLTKNCFI
jgi:hypothetical protein